MKYVLLIYQPHPFDPSTYSREEYQTIAAQYRAVNAMENVTAGPPLGLPQKAVTVTSRDGEALVREGPYAGIAGAVGGYMVFEAESYDEAVALAARIPAARLGGAVEVRLCETYW